MLYFLKRRFQAFCSKKCRVNYCLLFGRRTDTHKWRRYFGRFFFGLCCAAILWRWMLINFHLSLWTELIILGVMLICLGFGFMCSKTVRCITLLVFVACLGKSGRSYLRAMCFAYVIAGPIENLALNGAEVVRVFACSSRLTYNLTKARYDLMTLPYRRTLAGMKDEIRDVQETFNEVNKILEPLHTEIEGVDQPDDELQPNGKKTNQMVFRRSDSGDQIESNYKAKLKDRCKKQLSKGVLRCRQAFDKALDHCLQKLPFIVNQLLCWPFRVEFLCSLNILGDPEKVCDPSDALPRDFGETYENLNAASQQLYENGSSTEVKYEIHEEIRPPQIKSAEQTAENIIQEYDAKKRIFDSVMGFVKRFLNILFLRVIYASMKYFHKYLTDLDFDNIYVSEYFKHVDKRRTNAGKLSILPLKKFEKQKLVDLAKPCALSRYEFKEIIFHILQFFLEIITGCFFVLLDYLVVTLLTIIRNRSQITFVQDGEHTISFQIKGDGLLARLLHSTLRNFNMHEKVHTHLTNEACLPRPRVLPESYYIKLLLLYLGVLFLIYKNTAFLRMRRVICGYFYREREKQRILYLYNVMLKVRSKSFEKLLEEVQANAAKHKIRQRVNPLLALRLKYPAFCKCLKYFKVARRMCVICETYEDDDSIVCPNANCGVVYCDECWIRIGLHCAICHESIKLVQIINFDTFFETIIEE